eukprot:CAMPEP_0174943710 /NCGR_PEP_ID=MMETSP1355-20121228/77291_1 /TAXON_ID=464990 /ORGANISM="Hemiselmis tepida, Strain CCMP443" /LENGTH=89 /DNA_ID=CAMNT_0016190967 /DNA_START=104 /DNA_END=369 /DNA_ORIENTATION=-
MAHMLLDAALGTLPQSLQGVVIGCRYSRSVRKSLGKSSSSFAQPPPSTAALPHAPYLPTEGEPKVDEAEDEEFAARALVSSSSAPSFWA